MYVGTIVGAGFASGREIWQFFGVFGNKGLAGVFIVGILFIVMGFMASLIASMLRTSDMGRIIVPGNSQKLTEFVGYFMAVFLFTAIVNMSAAGGSLLNQQFNLPTPVGGAIVCILVVITVIGGFDRMSKVFAAVMPVVLVATVAISIMIINVNLPDGSLQEMAKPSFLAPNWVIAPVIYLSFNVLAIVPIVATSTRNAKTGKQGAAGAALGGVLLAFLLFLICKAMLTDPGHAQAMDIPMLALAGKLGPAANIIYTLIMFVAIYSSATGNFYGVTTKIKEGKDKNKKIIILSAIGFLLGLVGFKNIVAYVFPILGIIGLVLVGLLIVNFYKVVLSNLITTQEKHKYDFPEEVINVTTGRGGASLLLIGEDKTALIDTGMGYCGEQLVEKIKKHLGDRPLDYFFASHTHYDHIGALPSLRENWPDLITFGAEHGQEILKREGALRGIKKLGDEAAQMYSNGKVDHVSVEGMSIDRVVHDGDIVDLGGKQIVCLVLGIIGLVLVGLLIVNFYKVVLSNLITTQEKHKYDFPEEVINVTTGRGGASLLLIGEDKTALIDTGMGYCGEQLVEKIKKHLGDRPLDYFFASHTHYDHIGALPSLRENWPDLITFGAEHGQEILKREGALRGIKKLGDEAAQMYSNGKVDHVSVEGMSIDRVVHDGDIVDLGGKQIVCLETPGHTKCSITYVIEPLGVMLACESVGVLERRGMSHPAILNSFEDAVKSIEKCRAYDPKRIVVSHYGIVPAEYNHKLWDLFEREAYNERDLIQTAWKKGMTEEEILEIMTERYWYESRAVEQPLDAFQINMINTIRLYKI